MYECENQNLRVSRNIDISNIEQKYNRKRVIVEILNRMLGEFFAVCCSRCKVAERTYVLDSTVACKPIVPTTRGHYHARTGDNVCVYRRARVCIVTDIDFMLIENDENSVLYDKAPCVVSQKLHDSISAIRFPRICDRFVRRSENKYLFDPSLTEVQSAFVAIL